VILIITESQKRAYIHTVGLFNTIAFFAWGNMYSMWVCVCDLYIKQENSLLFQVLD